MFNKFPTLNFVILKEIYCAYHNRSGKPYTKRIKYGAVYYTTKYKENKSAK